jgi:hypothetical protein
MLLDNTPDDFKWYTRDRAGYEAEMDRKEQEYKRQHEEHMGPDYQTPYKPTQKELETQMDYRLSRIKRMRELKAPDPIIDNEQELINELAEKLVKVEFLVTDAEKAYREAYQRKEETFEFVFEVRKPDPALLKDDYTEQL